MQHQGALPHHVWGRPTSARASWLKKPLSSSGQRRLMVLRKCCSGGCSKAQQIRLNHATPGQIRHDRGPNKSGKCCENIIIIYRLNEVAERGRGAAWAILPTATCAFSSSEIRSTMPLERLSPHPVIFCTSLGPASRPRASCDIGTRHIRQPTSPDAADADADEQKIRQDSPRL